ncbi:hypothetical protein ES703_65820 [subsurface metagenome]
MEFPFTDSSNAASDSGFGNVYYVHFKATTALVRGVDYVTVTFPDGTETMSGTTGDAYAFTVGTLDDTDVLFSTDYDTTDLINTATWCQTTSNPTVGGTRAKVRLPIDIAAGQDVWVKFVDTSSSNAITTSTGEADTYKVYVSTTKDTTPVLSSTFSLGASGYKVTSTAVEDSYPVPTTAGATGEYIVKFDATHQVNGASGKVTLKFPVGTVLPSSISATEVQFKITDGSYSPCSETPVVDTDRRMITAIPSIDLTTGATFCYIKILAAAGITNPKIADTDVNYKVAVRTSADRQWDASSVFDITYGSGNKVVVGNGEIGKATTVDSGAYYSDDATMINMWSSQIYVVLADVNGNGLTPSSNTTLTVSSSSATGAFATNANNAAGTSNFTTGVTSTTIDTTASYDPAHASSLDDQIFYYKDSTAGTHTLTFKASGYADATWEITVCSGVSLYDASDNLVKTYAAPANTPVSETDDGGEYTQYYSGDYINSAIDGAIAGDTVKLGDGIYELDDDIPLDKKITLTSVNGAASTAIRPTVEPLTSPLTGYDVAILVQITGTAANPVIIDGLTITRLRYGTEFAMAIFNNGFDYVTVRNCVFDYIIPEHAQYSDSPYGSVVSFLRYDAIAYSGDQLITSGTISNNTFTNCCTFGFNQYGEQHNCISVMAKDEAETDKTISGVTISGNTLTDCNGIGIWLKGYNATHETVTASVTDNTLTNLVYPISVGGYTDSISILRNTITGGYMCGLWVEFTEHISLVIKNNTITGCAGTGAPSMDYSTAVLLYDDGGSSDPVTLQYNDIYDNDATYSIYAKSDITAAQSCQYNYYGDATGPYYSAVSGATVTKSNPNGTGDKISDKVTYYPWLHKPLTDVVEDNVSWQTSVMKLVAGWNTLSTPVPLIAEADTVQELIPSGMSIGYYYDGGWTQITTAYVLSPCDAVYVNMDEAKYVQLKFECKTFSTPSKDLAVGWNLISLASLASSGMQGDDAVASVYKDSANLPGYGQVISPSLNATRYDLYGNTGTSWAVSCAEHGDNLTTKLMFAGLGYWCYMQNACTLAGFEITPIAPDLD